MLFSRAGDFVGHASDPCEWVLLPLFLWIDLILWKVFSNTKAHNVSDILILRFKLILELLVFFSYLIHGVLITLASNKHEFYAFKILLKNNKLWFIWYRGYNLYLFVLWDKATEDGWRTCWGLGWEMKVSQFMTWCRQNQDCWGTLEQVT